MDLKGDHYLEVKSQCEITHVENIFKLEEGRIKAFVVERGAVFKGK